MKIWQIAVAVLLGIAFALWQPGKLTFAFGYATLYVFLPALLFEAAWNLNARALRREWAPIALLVGPGVAITALIVSGALLVARVPFGPALLTGAILCATDPIAVVAVFRQIKVPLALATIVEAESLFNDAIAVAIYRAVLAVIAGTVTAGSLGSIALGAIGGVIGGVAIGVVAAFVIARVLRNNLNHAAQLLATIVAAYGSYFAADALHCSGITATIACGIALRWFERSWITLTLTEEVHRLWDLAALVANALVFFLVGASLRITDVVREPVFVIATLAGVFVSRFAVSGLLFPTGVPRPWLDVVRVAGIRGALSLALALALPPSIPLRGAIVDATFAVTLVSLFGGVPFLYPVVRRAGVGR